VGLTERLLSAAATRPHVLLVPVPGRSDLRWAVEDWLDAQGWPQAASPAGADLLIECGTPAVELAERADAAWDALPGPRDRARVRQPDEVDAVLSAARSRLLDGPRQRQDAQERGVPVVAEPSGDMDPGGMDMGGMDDGGMDMGGMDMGGMDMGGMDMDLPGGLTMAGRVEDRDGLRLEGLPVRFGPLLPDWPAGLELQTTLSGDVLIDSRCRWLDPSDGPVPDRAVVPGPAAALDALSRLLAVAGWQDGARRARRARAEAGSGPATDDLLRRLRRTRLLRWSLRGLPAPEGRDLTEHLNLLIACVDSSSSRLPVATLHELDQAVTGLDVAGAVLVVAAYGPVLFRERVDA